MSPSAPSLVLLPSQYWLGSRGSGEITVLGAKPQEEVAERTDVTVHVVRIECFGVLLLHCFHGHSSQPVTNEEMGGDKPAQPSVAVLVGGGFE